ncbi:hypothetical protein B0T17DRAFT_177330 [Bombardia bombarda]|uniref:Ataxin-10 homolog n=1 Tax=Bombardia bombarda TaxID=252184 RepID=A0AA39X8L6_9PEZI|nr:hypothetical protein B0T17DRAFT_177330 [Bombardia bombarda]
MASSAAIADQAPPAQTPAAAAAAVLAADAASVIDEDRRPLTVEELCFSSAMSCFEAWLKLDPAIGPRTMAYVTKFISRTLEKTHNLKDVRETLSRSVEIWIWLTKVFAAAIPSLTTRSIGPLSSLNDPDKGVTPQESTALIIKNCPSLKEDLQLLIKLMHIARNLLVVPEPEIPQDLCAAAHFDQMLYQTIILCINITSKAYDGDILEETARLRLSEVTELCKKLLVTCLQQAHNWIAKNDRNKMTFWFTVLFDEDAISDDQESNIGLGDFRPDVARVEVRNWIERNSRFCDKARNLLVEYEDTLAPRGLPPGYLARISPLAWNWLPDGTVGVRADDARADSKITPHWKEDEPDKFEQDRLYGRVSREVDTWWLKVRDPNYDDWVVPMPTVEFAQQRTENCKANLVNRYAHSYRTDEHEGSVHSVHSAEGAPLPDIPVGEEIMDADRFPQDYNDDMIEEEDVDDDESYSDGPMSGLLTEVPNILDPKQIEALHMIVKSCILDNAGLALSRAGENLQKTRCRMFLALECGRSLLREILVFIAVWEKSEQSLIFQLTTQIVEAIHHSALIPYAWQSLRIPKDIISPAQTVLLRLVNNMFRARNTDPPPPDSKEHLRDVRLLHFLFIQFRSRIVPECAALMHLQAQIRNDQCEATEFPVDSWDMERAKDGLQQFLELLTTVNELAETRAYLIEWEAAYELLVLLKGLEAGVPKKSLVDMPNRANQQTPTANTAGPIKDDDRDHDYDLGDPPPPPPPPMQEPAHKFPWAGIKGQILHILAGLLQPPPGRSSPGNPEVQLQIIRHNGIVSLLNCCVYDDHNRYARERVQVCLKWLMDGSDAANNFLRELVAMSPPPNLSPSPATTADGVPLPPRTSTLRIDGIGGEVKVQLKAPSPGSGSSSGPANNNNKNSLALPSLASSTALLVDDIRNQVHTLPPIQSNKSPSASSSPLQSTRSRSEELLRDIITLADEAARLALGRRQDSDETEEEDFM